MACLYFLAPLYVGVCPAYIWNFCRLPCVVKRHAVGRQTAKVIYLQCEKTCRLLHMTLTFFSCHTRPGARCLQQDLKVSALALKKAKSTLGSDPLPPYSTLFLSCLGFSLFSSLFSFLLFSSLLCLLHVSCVCLFLFSCIVLSSLLSCF